MSYKFLVVALFATLNSSLAQKKTSFGLEGGSGIAKQYTKDKASGDVGGARTKTPFWLGLYVKKNLHKLIAFRISSSYYQINMDMVNHHGEFV